eukprot:scaffold10198_cov21-Tisochrysis_lutea.AAC.2
MQQIHDDNDDELARVHARCVRACMHLCMCVNLSVCTCVQALEWVLARRLVVLRYQGLEDPSVCMRSIPFQSIHAFMRQGSHGCQRSRHNTHTNPPALLCSAFLCLYFCDISMACNAQRAQILQLTQAPALRRPKKQRNA